MRVAVEGLDETMVLGLFCSSELLDTLRVVVETLGDLARRKLGRVGEH